MRKIDPSQLTSLDSIAELEAELEADKVGRLLTAAVAVADARLDLLGSRTEILTHLIDLTEAAGGTWAWGVADEEATASAPLASISVGLSAAEEVAVIKTGLSDSIHEKSLSVIKVMQGRSQITTLRTDLWDDPQWKSTQMFANLNAGGLGECLHSVRENW